MKFDQILSFLNDIVKKELFTNKEYIKGTANPEGKKTTINEVDMNTVIDSFKQKLSTIKVPKSLLFYLEKEYFVMKNTTTKALTSLQNN